MAQSLDDAVMALAHLDRPFLERMVEDATWDRYLAEHRGDQPYFMRATTDTGKVSADGRVVRPSPSHELITEPSVVPGGLHQALTAGQTFVIHRLDQYDRGAMGDLVEDMETVFGNLVSVNCYVSRNGATGFGPHWDDHHVLILQVRGEKMWEVYQPAHLSPERGYVEPEATGEQVWSGVLQPGQALVIPRGWSHSVVGFDELSVHYTVAFSGRHVHSVIELLLDGLPSRPDLDVRAWVSDHLADADDLVERSVASLRASLRPRYRSGLEAIERWQGSGSDPAQVRILLPGMAVFQGDPPDDGGVHLAWADSVVQLSAGEVEGLVAHPDQTAASASLIQWLLTAGLARIDEP